MAVLDRVWVTLLSGRACHCDPSQDRTISELKDEAESRLGIRIMSLIGPDKQRMVDFTKTLAEAEIRPGVTLTAVASVFDELSPIEFASVELPTDPDGQSQSFLELQNMKRDAVRLTSLVAEVAYGVLLIYSGNEAKPTLAPVDEDSEESPELPKDHNACSKLFKLLPEGVSFRERVRLVVPAESGANIAMRSNGGAWEALPTFFGTRYAEVAMDHFSFLQFFRRLMGFEQQEEPAHSPAVPRPLTTQRRRVLISARFNKPERLNYLKRVKRALEELDVPVYMVDVGPGEDFGMPTMAGLYHARMMVAFCTEDYGGQTGARFETFHELRYPWEKALMIVPVLLCRDFPPKPPDLEGRIQNDFVLSTTTIRIDGMTSTVEEVAKKLDEAWQKQLQSERQFIDLNLD